MLLSLFSVYIINYEIIYSEQIPEPHPDKGTLMDLIVSLAMTALTFIVGLIFAIFPNKVLKAAARGAKSYMPEEGLTSDPTYSFTFRAFGVSAIILSLYMLYQILTFTG